MKEGNSGEAAWVLRDCFDQIMDGSIEARDKLAAMPPQGQGRGEIAVLDFERGIPCPPRWYSMDDAVMGGISRSALTWDASTGGALFQGE